MSNVSGENLDLLRMFLNLLSTRMPCNYSSPAEFQIDETFAVPVSFNQICLIIYNRRKFSYHGRGFQIQASLPNPQLVDASRPVLNLPMDRQLSVGDWSSSG